LDLTWGSKDADVEQIIKTIAGCESEEDYNKIDKQLSNFERKFDKQLRAEQKRFITQVENILRKMRDLKKGAVKASGLQFIHGGVEITISDDVVREACRKFKITTEQVGGIKHGFIGKSLDIKKYARLHAKRDGYLKVFIKREVKTINRDVLLFIDISGSMTDWISGVSSKGSIAITAAFAITKALLDKNGRVIAYTFPAFVVKTKKGHSWSQHKIFDTNITKNLKEIRERIENLKIGGGTPLLDALTEFYNELSCLALERPIAIVVTDGVVSDPNHVCELLRKLQRMGIQFICLHIGSEEDYMKFREEIGREIECVRVDPRNLVRSLMELASQIVISKR